MTGGAQRLKVAIIQSRASLSDRNDMVHYCCLCKLPGFAALHTERMLDQIVPTKLPPFPGMIELCNILVTESGIILRIHQFLMLGAVPFVC